VHTIKERVQVEKVSDDGMVSLFSGLLGDGAYNRGV